MKFAVPVAVVVACLKFYACAAESSDNSTIYNPDPARLCNRLNETLFLRAAPDGKKYGLDELDILYWHTTKNLLSEPSHQAAVAVLDEFIKSHGENLIREPVKRALLQRDLWELFDWSAKERRADNARACRDLQLRLATVIRRLALTSNEIASLPDNYAEAEKAHLADLPAGMSDTNGDWVCVGLAGSVYSGQPVAPTHMMNFDGHSAFSVMLHMPGGRKAALDYLDKLRLFKQNERVWAYQSNHFTWVSTNEPREVLSLSTNLPQFETNTEWALVRRMCLIAADGSIQPTPVTESIQLRRYLRTDKGIPDQRFATNDVQQFREFELDKRQNAALRAIGRDDKGFPTVHFMGKGIDLFETSHGAATPQSRLLGTCFECHSSRGLFSVLSYVGFSPPARANLPAHLVPEADAVEAFATKYWKEERYDWGLLQGLWLQNP
jgi:hypothetical protein